MAAEAREADLLSAIKDIEGRGRCATRTSAFVTTSWFTYSRAVNRINTVGQQLPGSSLS